MGGVAIELLSGCGHVTDVGSICEVAMEHGVLKAKAILCTQTLGASIHKETIKNYRKQNKTGRQWMKRNVEGQRESRKEK